MRFAVAMLLLLITATVAAAIDCRSSRGGGGYQSWRYVDGRKCWYVGRPGMPKSRLHWRTTARPQPVPLPRYETVTVDPRWLRAESFEQGDTADDTADPPTELLFLDRWLAVPLQPVREPAPREPQSLLWPLLMVPIGASVLAWIALKHVWPNAYAGRLRMST